MSDNPSEPRCSQPEPFHGWPPDADLREFAWLNTHIRYWFVQDYNYDKRQADIVEWAFKSWEAFGIGIAFMPAESENEADIRIGFHFPHPRAGMRYAARRTATRLGTEAMLPAYRGDAFTMEFGWNLRTAWGRATALHEVGHALGLIHEHQRMQDLPRIETPCAHRRFMDHNPARANERAAMAREAEANVSDVHELNVVNARSPSWQTWDVRSIMHYPMPERTIAKPSEYFYLGTPRNHTLSALDGERIRDVYPNIPPPTPVSLTVGTPHPIRVDATGQAVFKVTRPPTGTFTLRVESEDGSPLAIDSLTAIFLEDPTGTAPPRLFQLGDDRNRTRSDPPFPQANDVIVSKAPVGTYIARVRVLRTRELPAPDADPIPTGAQITLLP